MGANLEHKGLKEVLDSFTLKTEDDKIKDVNNDWMRLASFMSGRK